MAGLIHITGEDGKELSQDQARAFLQKNGMGHLGGLVGDDDIQVGYHTGTPLPELSPFAPTSGQTVHCHTGTQLTGLKEEPDDKVVSPSHYVGKTETIDVIEDAGCLEGFVHGNAIKYICRLGRKKGQSFDDAKKALWYTLFYFFKVCGGSKDEALQIVEKTYGKANQ